MGPFSYVSESEGISWFLCADASLHDPSAIATALPIRLAVIASEARQSTIVSGSFVQVGTTPQRPHEVTCHAEELRGLPIPNRVFVQELGFFHQ